MPGLSAPSQKSSKCLVSDKRFDIHLPQAPNVRILLASRSVTSCGGRRVRRTSRSPGATGPTAMTMRIRLDPQKFGPDAFKYTADADRAVFGVEF